MASITSANSVLIIGVASIFPTASQLKGFGQDDMYSMDQIDNAETRMGVDGVLSAGWIPQIKKMAITLEADSPSADFFEQWYAQEELAQEKFFAFGTIRQPAVGKIITLSSGVMRNYSPIADAGKVLKPRRFSIEWQVALPSPV